MEQLTKKPMWNNDALWRLLWPLTIEQGLAITIGIVDTVMVAGVGEVAVSGVSLVDSINLLMIQVFTALATGGAVVASQYLGRRQQGHASEAARQLAYVVSLFSVVMMVLVLALNTPILRLIYGRLEEGVMSAANTYLFYSALSYPFIALYNAGAALFRSMGNSRISMAMALLVNVLNIGGNALLIYGANLGVAGAAISTLVSRAVAAVVLLALLLRKNAHTPITLRGLFRFKLNGGMLKSILKVGVPNGLENSTFHIGKLMVARIISTFGTSAIAGNAIAMAMASFLNLPGGAVSMGLLTVVGQCVGAKEYGQARVNNKKLMWFARLGMAGLALVVGVFARPIIGMFGLSAEASQIAWVCVLAHCVMGPVFWPQSFSLPNALRAAGDARFTMVVAMASMWVFRIGIAFPLAYWLNLGVYGVWIGMFVDWIARGISFLLRWKSGKWQGKNVLQ